MLKELTENISSKYKFVLPLMTGFYLYEATSSIVEQLCLLKFPYIKLEPMSL